MSNASHAWSHMLDMHLHVLPRAYALIAKQKSLYRYHEQAYGPDWPMHNPRRTSCPF